MYTTEYIYKDISSLAVVEKNRTILCVDDEKHLLRLYRKILERPVSENSEDRFPVEPFRVILAHGPDEALEIFGKETSAGRRIGVGFIDLVMPGMDGFELIYRLRKKDPDIRFAIVTGVDEPEFNKLKQSVSSPSQWLYIKKPFDSQEVVQAAYNLCDSWNLAQRREQKTKQLMRQKADWVKKCHAAEHLNEEVNEKLEKQIIRVHESEIRYKSLFEHASDAIMLMNSQGVILEANTAACKLFAASNLKEMSYETLLSLPGENFRKIVNQPAQTRHYVNSQGKVIIIELSVFRIPIGGQSYYYGVARDISAQTKYLQEIESKNKQLFMLLDLNRIITSGLELDQMNTLFAEKITRLAQCCYCIIAFYNKKSDEIYRQYFFSLRDLPGQVSEESRLSLSQAPYHKRMFLNNCEIVVDFTEEPLSQSSRKEVDFFAVPGTKTILMLPL
ncbi:MAG: PAS domain S-box protein, partial [bacterium]